MTMQTLFGEQHIKIEGNPLLEGIANHILDLKLRYPDLEDGDTMAYIDRHVALKIWYDEGLGRFIPEDKRAEFEQWFCSPKTCPDYDAITRARRYLQEKGLFRPTAKAILDAERHRQRIARSVKSQ